jgi:hypothetical protein
MLATHQSRDNRGRKWTNTCARQHDPSRRYIATQIKNGKRYAYQRCRDCDKEHRCGV